MRRSIGIAIALLCVATLAALLSADLLGYRSDIQRGDRAFALDPPSASWRTHSLLPLDPAGWLLAAGTDLDFRQAAQSFEAVSAAGPGVDLGLSEAESRGGVEADLAAISRTGPAGRTSAADNMLGILAFADSRPTGESAPAPVDQSVGAFQAAVRADPTNEAARYNLELLLHRLVAKGTRRGPNGSSSGPSLGRNGASGGLPGHGY